MSTPSPTPTPSPSVISKENLRENYLQIEEARKTQILETLHASITQGVTCANRLGKTSFVSKNYTYKADYMDELVTRLSTIYVDSQVYKTVSPGSQATAIVIDWS